MFVIDVIDFLHQNSPPYSGYSWLKWAGFSMRDLM